MRGKRISMDGLYEDGERGIRIASTRALGAYNPFYVAGERHENLPAGGFAGTPCQTVIRQPMEWEFATGSSGQFGKQASRKGRGMKGQSMVKSGATMVGMGFDWSDLQDTISSVSDTVSDASDIYSSVQSAISPQQQQQTAPPPPTVITQYVPAPLQNAAKSIMSYKIGGVPAVVIGAVAIAGLFIYTQARRK